MKDDSNVIQDDKKYFEAMPRQRLRFGPGIISPFIYQPLKQKQLTVAS